MANSFFLDKFQEHNLKVTPQRTIIYEEMLKSDNHPDTDEIYNRVRQKLSNISYDTVHRTLVTFAEIGLIDTVEGYGEPKRYDPNMEPHHHFRCVRCKKIIDIYCDEFNGIKIPEKYHRKYDIASLRVILKGVCKDCR